MLCFNIRKGIRIYKKNPAYFLGVKNVQMLSLRHESHKS